MNPLDQAMGGIGPNNTRFQCSATKGLGWFLEFQAFDLRRPAMENKPK